VHLALIIGRLRSKAEDPGTKLTNLGVMVTEGTRLRCAASRTGNFVLSGRDWNTCTTGEWTGVKQSQARPLVKVDLMA
jgi:hypothetical protein